MTDNVLYWVFMGLEFALTLGIGLWLMRRTNRLHFSFAVSTIINVLLTAAASVWWAGVNTDSFTVAFGLAFNVIACVNVAVIDFFALVSIRRKQDESKG